MFENCYPNTLDAMVEIGKEASRPDAFIPTGDIDPMWLRDSSCQVSPYLPLAQNDSALQRLLRDWLGGKRAVFCWIPTRMPSYLTPRTRSHQFRGSAAEGIGGPHVGLNMIWPMSLITRALTSNDDQEIQQCLAWIKTTHAGMGFIQQAFNKDNPTQFTRAWFAWGNSLFGELIVKLSQERPALLKSVTSEVRTTAIAYGQFLGTSDA
jgi:meiotically up-regulated gene 157 (Mug157) protein